MFETFLPEKARWLSDIEGVFGDKFLCALCQECSFWGMLTHMHHRNGQGFFILAPTTQKKTRKRRKNNNWVFSKTQAFYANNNRQCAPGVLSKTQAFDECFVLRISLVRIFTCYSCSVVYPLADELLLKSLRTSRAAVSLLQRWVCTYVCRKAVILYASVHR